MKDIQQLRNNLLTQIDGIRDGSMSVKEAEAVTNTAGKILGTIAMELKLAEMNKEKPNIPFLSYDKKLISDGTE